MYTKATWKAPEGSWFNWYTDACSTSGGNDNVDGGGGSSIDAGTPPSFSRVTDTTAACTEGTDIAKEFPLYRTAAVTECEIEEGSMLYLPAGWFHEVLSFSTIDASKANGTAAASSNGRAAAAEPSVHEHLALNYWVHPPDTASFDAPYSSSYWTDEWKLRTAAT